MAKGIFLTIMHSGAEASEKAFRNAVKYLSEDSRTAAESIFSLVRDSKPKSVSSLKNVFGETGVTIPEKIKSAAKLGCEPETGLFDKIKNLFRGNKQVNLKPQNVKKQETLSKKMNQFNESSSEFAHNIGKNNKNSSLYQNSNVTKPAIQKSTSANRSSRNSTSVKNTKSETIHSELKKSSNERQNPLSAKRENTSFVSNKKPNISTNNKNVTAGKTKTSNLVNSDKKCKQNTVKLKQSFTRKLSNISNKAHVSRETILSQTKSVSEQVAKFRNHIEEKSDAIRNKKIICNSNFKQSTNESGYNEIISNIQSQNMAKQSHLGSSAVTKTKSTNTRAKQKIVKAKTIPLKSSSTNSIGSNEHSIEYTPKLKFSGSGEVTEQQMLLLLNSDTITLRQAAEMLGEQDAFMCIFKNPILLKKYEREAIEYIITQKKVDNLVKMANSGRAIELILNFNRVDNKNELYKSLEKKASSLQKFMFENKTKSAA